MFAAKTYHPRSQTILQLKHLPKKGNRQSTIIQVSLIGCGEEQARSVSTQEYTIPKGSIRSRAEPEIAVHASKPASET